MNQEYLQNRYHELSAQVKKIKAKLKPIYEEMQQIKKQLGEK
jgi:prefoldin subunit 5